MQVNPAAISSLGLSLEDVRTILGEANVNAPKGSFDGPRQVVHYRIERSDFFGRGLQANHRCLQKWAPVRLGDIANIIDSVENDQLGGMGRQQEGETTCRSPRHSASAGREHHSNRRKSEAVAASLDHTLPPSVTSRDPGRSHGNDPRLGRETSNSHLLLTIVLVVMVMFLFLRKFWTTVITSVALPLSLIGTFGIMYLAGFSLDNLSLMALTISTGFVVDDAIVMIENIVRYIEDGDPPLEAALKGAKQIGFTVISLSVSLVAVFIATDPWL